MPRGHVWLLAPLLLGVVAGCLGPGAADEEPPLPGEGLAEPAWTGCRYWFTRDDVVDGASGDQPPGNWTESSGFRHLVMAEVWECERVALGLLERGPVRLYFEYTESAEVPGACDSDDSVARILRFAVASDQDLADALEQRFLMPMIPGEIVLETTILGPSIERHNAEIAVDAASIELQWFVQTTSTLDLSGVTDIWWDHGSGVGRMTTAYDYWQHPNNPHGTLGQASGDTALARMANGWWLAPGAVGFDVEQTTRMALYADYQCDTELDTQ